MLREPKSALIGFEHTICGSEHMTGWILIPPRLLNAQHESIGSSISPHFYQLDESKERTRTFYHQRHGKPTNQPWSLRWTEASAIVSGVDYIRIKLSPFIPSHVP
ncbi:hypothetical protein CBL_07914 [Carabus blaptoides fortunei]